MVTALEGGTRPAVHAGTKEGVGWVVTSKTASSYFTVWSNAFPG